MKTLRTLFAVFSLATLPLLAQTVGPISISSTQCATIGVSPAAAVVGIQATGTWTGTLQPKGTIQGQSAFNVLIFPAASATSASTITANGAYFAVVSGYSTFQLCGATVATGSASVFLNISQASQSASATVTPVGSVTTGIVTSGLLAQYQLTEGTGTTINDASGNGNSGTFGAGGNAPTWLTGEGLQYSGGQFVTLPTGLSSAATIQIFASQTSISTQNYSSLLGGNGTTVQSNRAIFLANGNQFITVPGNTNANAASNNITTAVSGQCTLCVVSRGGLPGAALITVLYDTTDRIMVNNQELLPYAQTAASVASNPMTAGLAYQLGGGAANVGFAQTTYFTGNIYYALFYNRVLSTSEVAQNYVAITTFMSQHGALPAQQITSTTKTFIADGDSITRGVTTVGPLGYPSYIVLNNTWKYSNLGTAGLTLLQAVTQAPLTTDLLLPTQAPGILLVWAGTNDIKVSGTAPEIVANMVDSYAALRRKTGLRVLMATMIDRTGVSSQKNSLNAFLRQNWGLFADGLVDIAADPNLGCDACNANTTYFSDTTHPTTFATINNVTPVMQRAINRLMGNGDFSTATTYAAAALAATATTAGSESTNTVTITFAATPANCQAGNTITLAGITPAGYNGAFFILTRTATQITAFNSNTGLGAISVQGTGVCPQQQDADQYTVLNFGAGNFTLQSCVGYTGQNIYIKNINAGASTVVPFGAETIDGAASVSVATKATLVLEDILTSASAGGCSWKQLQNN